MTNRRYVKGAMWERILDLDPLYRTGYEDGKKQERGGHVLQAGYLQTKMHHFKLLSCTPGTQ